MDPVVKFPRYLKRRFLKEAKALFPNEAYALILGVRLDDGSLEIKDLFIPEDIQKYSTPEFVNVPDEWFRKAHELAFYSNSIVLGDIHSHCYRKNEGITDATPSEGDYRRVAEVRKYMMHYYSILGILRLVENQDGSIKSRLMMYQPACSFRVIE